MEKLREILEKLFKEHITTDGLSEIETIFEASVNELSTKKTEELKLEMEETNKAEMEKFKESLIKTLDTYCDLAAEEYMKENSIAMESKAKVEMAEDLISKLSESFKEYNYPADKETDDIIKTLEAKIEKYESEKTDLINEQIEAKKEIFEYQKSVVFKTVTEGMALTEKEKLLNLVSDISCKDEEDFKTKLETIKTKFLTIESGDKNKDVNGAEILDEDKNEKDEDTKSSVDIYAPKVG